MVMTLVWNDAQAFKQHLERMRMFRQTHRRDLEGRLAPLKEMPILSNISPPVKTGGARGSITIGGEPALVPVWEITPPRHSQN